MRRDTLSSQFFENKYRYKSDPWEFASSDYEQSRYQVAFEALKDHRYERAFEPGCSIGAFTARLATICDRVEAMDISFTAAMRARERCKELRNVNITCGAFPTRMPSGSFDVMVMNEIGYYFDEEQLQEIGKIVLSRLRRPGSLLAVHWLGTSEDHLLSGDRVHEILGGLGCLVHSRSERYPGFRLDLWQNQ